QTLAYLLNHYTNIKFFWIMGADNLISFHKWQKWRQILKEVSIVVFKRHGYNNQALKSIACRTFANYRINSHQINKNNFIKLPSWAWVDNREIKISSTEIRQQRLLLRGKN
ncbi:MAG TPA: nicotinic acid mononucleotide adenylyltransferase, partial [Alphaproteobacteria bacterium]|nr:nicotinic acid mononucleotide adenylyltransferase [Alphaproteobacteria bacterium]